MTSQPEFDFWDFVGCAVCQLPFSPQDRGPPPVPFWITECGHVLCNAHLNPNQSCAKCGEQAIQLVPLQRNIDPPMSDWFRSLPHAIDSVANAVKFQQESLAALVRHYRNQCLQLAATCDRLRNDRRSLRKDAEDLRRELHLCHSRGLVADQSQEPSAHINRNGKRPMAETQGLVVPVTRARHGKDRPSQGSSIRTHSSPRSIPTPVGPLRLTLPPGEHPTFTRQEPPGQAYAIDRPGSSRFAEQYAYHGEGNLRAKPSHSTDRQPPRLPDVSRATMPPPPPPSYAKRSKPATTQSDQTMEISTPHSLGPQPGTNMYESMGPPPTPQRPFSAALRMPSRVPTTLQTTSTLQTNRFTPSSGFTPAGSAGSKASGGNRVPFLPQSSNGFRR